MTTSLAHTYHDGGRAAAGYRGHTRDCSVRAWAIVTGRPYQEVYDRLWALSRLVDGRRHKRRRRGPRGHSLSPRAGVSVKALHLYAAEVGWEWTPTMTIGSGCRVHLRYDELPAGKLVARVSRHVCAVLDGTVHDTHNPSRAGTRCVYGYWRPIATGFRGWPLPH